MLSCLPCCSGCSAEDSGCSAKHSTRLYWQDRQPRQRFANAVTGRHWRHPDILHIRSYSRLGTGEAEPIPRESPSECTKTNLDKPARLTISFCSICQTQPKRQCTQTNPLDFTATTIRLRETEIHLLCGRPNKPLKALNKIGQCISHSV